MQDRQQKVMETFNALMPKMSELEQENSCPLVRDWRFSFGIVQSRTLSRCIIIVQSTRKGVNRMLVCGVILENGETVEMEEGNRLIEDVVGCLKERDLSAGCACFILEQARLEVTRRARLN